MFTIRAVYVYEGISDEIFLLNAIHEYLHYISSQRIKTKFWTGVRYNYIWPWSTQIGVGLNEAITEYLTEILIYGDKEEKTYGYGVELIDRLSDIVGMDNILKNFFAYNLEYFVNLFLLPINNKFANRKEFLETFDYVALSNENPVGNVIFVEYMTHIRKALSDIKRYLS